MTDAPNEDWDNPWYATWRFSRLPRPAKAAILAYVEALKKEKAK